MVDGEDPSMRDSWLAFKNLVEIGFKFKNVWKPEP